MLTCHFKHSMVLKGYLHPHEHCQSARHAGHYLRKLKDRAAQNIPLIPVSIPFSVDLSQWRTRVRTHTQPEGDFWWWGWEEAGKQKWVRREPREADGAVNPSNNLMKEHIVPAVVPPFPSNQTFLSTPKGLKKKRQQDELLEASRSRKVVRYLGFQSGATQTVSCQETLRSLWASTSSLLKWKWYFHSPYLMANR